MKEDDEVVLLNPIYKPGRTPEYLDPAPVEDSGEPGGAVAAVEDLTQPPFCSTGRLSVYRPHAPDGKYLQHGTAHFISQRLLLTAAHMVWWNENEASNDGDLDHLERNQIEEHHFVPAYGPDTPHEPVYRIDKIAILHGWPRWRLTPNHVEAAFKFDMAVLRIDGVWDGPVTPVSRIAPGDTEVRAIGYPRNFCDGLRMICTTGKLLERGRYGGMVGMDPNPMMEGASGGPWIVRRGAGAQQGNHVIGLTSIPDNDTFTADDSPEFGEHGFPRLQSLIAALEAED